MIPDLHQLETNSCKISGLTQTKPYDNFKRLNNYLRMRIIEMINRPVGTLLFTALGILFAISVFAFGPSVPSSETSDQVLTEDLDKPWTIQISDQRTTSDSIQSGHLLKTVPFTTVTYTDQQNNVQQVGICQMPDQLYVIYLTCEANGVW